MNFMVNIEQGIHKKKSKVAWNKKWKKKNYVNFSYRKNICSKYVAYHWTITLSANLLFQKSAMSHSSTELIGSWWD